MQCPNCQHEAPALVKCRECGTVYERAEVERLAHLEYVVEWLEQQSQLVTPTVSAAALTAAQAQLAEARARLGKPSTAPAPTVAPQPMPAAPPATPVLKPGTPIFPLEKIEPPTPVVPPAPVAPPVEVLRRTPPIPATPIAEPKPIPVVPKAAPAPPPAPRPPFNWEKAWDQTWRFISSGALLRGLLYLGAFMIAVSAIVLVVRFWNSFPPLAQMGLVTAVPLAFYGGGWVLRDVVKVRIAGGVFIGLGALLAAVDTIAIYQLGNLSTILPPEPYWLIASVICLVLYAGTVWWLREEFFIYLTLLAVGSTVGAAASAAGLPWEWRLAAGAWGLAAMAGAAVGLKPSDDFGEQWRAALRRLPQVLGPAVAFVVAALGLFLPTRDLLALAATSWGLTALYAILAWNFPLAYLGLMLACASLGGVGLTLAYAAQWWQEWIVPLLPVAALAYFAGAYAIQHRTALPKDLRVAYQREIQTAGWLCWGVGFLWGLVGFQEWWALLALALSAGVLFLNAKLLARPFLVLGGALLLAWPVMLSAEKLWELQAVGGYVAVGWAGSVGLGLGLIYLGLATWGGIALAYRRWLALAAHAVTAPLAGIAVLILAVDLWTRWAALTTGRQMEWALWSAVTLALLVYGVSTIMHASERHPVLSEWVEPNQRTFFLWPLCVLLPSWLAATWLALNLSLEWLGLGWALLAVGLALVGQAAFTWYAPYRRAPQVVAFLLGAGALSCLPLSRLPATAWANLGAIYSVVLAWGIVAVAHRRPWLTVLPAVLFLWPFALTLNKFSWPTELYPLAGMLLAALGYVPLGIALQGGLRRELGRTGQGVAQPLYWVGYTVAGLALLASLNSSRLLPVVIGQFRGGLSTYTWSSIAVPALALALYIFSLYHFRLVGFAWAAVGALSLTVMQSVVLFDTSWRFGAVTLVSMAVVYLLSERALQRWGNEWLQLLRWPLGVAYGLCGAIGLYETREPTRALIVGSTAVDFGPALLAQTLSVVGTVLGAALYRWRGWLVGTTVLAWWAATVATLGYGPSVVGRDWVTLAEVSVMWAALAWVFCLIGLALDQVPERYAHPLYGAGYLLTVVAVFTSLPNPQLHLWVFGFALVLLMTSQVLVHFGQHRTFSDLLQWAWPKPAANDGLYHAAKAAFLFVAAYAFPLWLWELLGYLNVAVAWRGLAFSITAAVYIALGLGLRAAREKAQTPYHWPLYSAGYALTFVGLWFAFANEPVLIYTLLLNGAIYTASAYLFRQNFWLYLANACWPLALLLTLHYNYLLTSAWMAGSLMALAYAYFGVAQWLENSVERGEKREKSSLSTLFSPPSTAFSLYYYLLSALALLVALRERDVAVAVYLAGAGLYALAAWLTREMRYLYPASWLPVVPYYLGLTYTTLPREWYGLAFLPFVAGYIALGRGVFHRQPIPAAAAQLFTSAWRDSLGLFTHPAMPFYWLAYLVSVGMPVFALRAALPLTLTLAACAGVYAASAAVFRRASWLYPTLFAAHAAVLTSLAITPSDAPAYYATLPFLGVTWAVALLGLAFTRFFPVQTEVKFTYPSLRHLLTPSWAQPFFIFTVLDAAIWQSLALAGYETGFAFAVGLAVLWALLATLWIDTLLVYSALGFAGLALGVGLRWAGWPWGDVWAAFSGAGLGFYLLSRLLALGKTPRLGQWVQPLERLGLGGATLAAVMTLPLVFAAPSTTALALGALGLLYLAWATAQRQVRWGYAALALLQAAWALLLLDGGVREPQFYAIPAGLYFLGLSYFERRQPKPQLVLVVELLGLAVLLLTTFIQSLDGATGFGYFVLLLVDALLAVGWGAVRRYKNPFFVGLGASVVNVMAQVIVLTQVYNINNWFVILGVGMVLMLLAVFVERQRERLLAQAAAWRDALETWS